MEKRRLGRFGEFVKQYEAARSKYPVEVFDFLNKYLPSKAEILDLGCGTGISTRQLAKYGKVTGCDPDPTMLAAARRHTRVNVEKYVRGIAEELPFKDGSFDAVTAFASFHWFNNKKAIREIKRVLKPKGFIFVVNKDGFKSWGEGYRKSIMKSINKEIAHFNKDQFNAKRDLAENNFERIKVKTWPKSELFSLHNALEYVQSVSIWQSVEPNERETALNGLTAYFKKMLRRQGKIERRLIVRAVLGHK